MKSSRGFTLIELLVVISIVALLSSVVLASLNSARGRARAAAGKQFAGYAERAMGDRAVGIWDFDECSGTTASDRSGSNNSGTFNGMSGTEWSADTPTGTGCSVQFDGTDKRVRLPGAVNTMLVTTTEFSFCAWVKPVDLTYRNILVRYGNSDNSFRLGISGGVLSAYFRASAAYAKAASGPFPFAGEWSHVCAVNDLDTSTIGLYLNGVQLTGGLVSMSQSSTGGAAIGNFYGLNNGPFDGLIDEARLFEKALTASEVGKLYAQGVEARRLAGEI